MTVEAFAPAKVNLTLHVTGQRADGYHLLDSLVVFADVGDVLDFEAGKGVSMTVTGPFAEGVPVDRTNLVWQAAEKADWTGHITLTKNLPHGGGIGGGSADAAATLRTLGGQVHAAQLGADVPVCLRSKATHMCGVGDDLTPVNHLPANLWAVLVNPGVVLPTRQVFAQLTAKSNPPMDPLPEPGTGAPDWISWIASQRNDLEAPTAELAPEVERVLATLRANDQIELARMSGSGTTCFGLCSTAQAARQVCRDVSDAHPEWWTCAVKLS